MKKSELNKYRDVLEAKQAELAQLVRNRDGIAIEKSPDAFDEVQHATERELAIRNLDRESGLLRKVKAAQYVASHPGEVCPAKWTPGADTLKPSLDLVGKI